ncbi:MAG: HEAT repeat domain-containing protein [Planctomycetes bacterium]|nr:HEAT repeat domain-containing protein [Planctomycetota bacterium]
MLALALLTFTNSASAQDARKSAFAGGLERALAEPGTAAELRRRFASLDAAELPQLFAFVVEGRVPGSASGSPALRASTGEDQRQIARECLAARPRREIVPLLEDLAGRPQETMVRLQAQRLLGAMGSGDHIKLLARLTVSQHERVALAPELRAGFTAALDGILARDAAGVSQVAALFSESSPGLSSAIVESLARLDSLQATRILAGQLGRTPGLDPLLLARLGERGRLGWGSDESVRYTVRRYLGQRDPALVSAAARASGQLGDDGAVEALVGLMEHEDERVRTSVFEALASISGMAFGPDPARWTSWHNAEMRWWDEEAEALLVRIERGRGLEFVRAAGEVLEHGLFRDRIAESFSQALARGTPAEVRLACRALEQLRSRQAINGLLECLEREEPEVREAAMRALNAITGAELSPELGSWDELAG